MNKYQCKSCGTIITQDEYISDIENGSNGMCFCEYDPLKILNRFVKMEN